MKKIFLLIIMCTISSSNFAQDIRLFENQWFLYALEIEGINYPVPQNDEIGDVELKVMELLFTTELCDFLFQGDEITISNSEIIITNFIIAGLNSCEIQENIDYIDLHFFQFYNIQLENRIFEYTIDTDGSGLDLTLINQEGYKAYYGSVPLGVSDLKTLGLSMYPNPTNDLLVIEAINKTGKHKIQIYSPEGKLLKTQNIGFNKQASIDVSNLSNGIYFLKIEDEQGDTETKRFIKE